MGMPRQQDPTINFNWISIITALPGASAEDVEDRITDPIEDAINGISDINFVSSNSRENTSSILVRFEDLSSEVYEKRLSSLRRELQSAQDLLPDEAIDSIIIEITSGNAFPAGMIAVTALADDELLRKSARSAEQSIEQMSGVDRVDTIGLDDPELQINFEPDALESYGLLPGQLSDAVQLWFQDTAAGNLNVGRESWLVRLVGKTADPAKVSELPIPALQGEIDLARVATIQRGRKKASQDVRIDGKPAILLSVMKQDNTNILNLIDRLGVWVDDQNRINSETGVTYQLVDDQTIPTQKAIDIMQSNALIGLMLVLVVAWLFLGTKIAVLTVIGIPFILALTFWVLSSLGETLNVTVLLAVVIVLGMLVDDAVVVVEAIYYRLQRGMKTLDAVLGSMQEVALPVTTAVLTTIAAFLPLMLVPGILGKFMRVIPMVVTIALLISLIEAFWMLPSHINSVNINFQKKTRMQRWREGMIHWIQLKYAKLLIKGLRWPKLTMAAIVFAFFTAIGALAAGLIKVDFFAGDTLRIFYVNVEMNASTPLAETLKKTLEVESQIKKHLLPQDTRSVAAYGGLMLTETEPMNGDQYGQIIVSLNPLSTGARPVDEIIEGMRSDVTSVVGAENISFLRLASGPPASKAISVKVRGDDYTTIKAASADLYKALNNIKGVKDITNDASRGRMELTLRMNHDAIRRAGLNPRDITRTIRLLVDGEVVSEMQDAGEKLQIRVKSAQTQTDDIGKLLNFRVPLPAGGSIPLSRLVTDSRKVSLGNIRHYNFRKAITIEADLVKLTEPENFWDCRVSPMLNQTERDYNKCQIDTVTANDLLKKGWEPYQSKYPTVDLDFSGQLDDINDSINSLVQLAMVGIGLMYLILGTQFKSYFQPIMILTTVPLAFTGVILGLLVTQNPLSLYTMYGVVALIGIAVNAAIVLISAANDRFYSGMSVVHATVFAARRRVVPILITTMTTIAGLFSLATGIGGKSLLWGPVATAIVWGVGFSAFLTLFTIPTLYTWGMSRKVRKQRQREAKQDALKLRTEYQTKNT